MKRYEVEITDVALKDMEELYHHIAFILLSPENAMGQYNRIANADIKIRYDARALSGYGFRTRTYAGITKSRSMSILYFTRYKKIK